MVDWKEYPNLFWNGKFRFIHEGVLIPNDSFSSLDLTDHGETPTDICIERQNDTPEWIDVRNCLLLARKIDSLNSDEVKSLPSFQILINTSFNWWRRLMCADAQRGEMSVSDMLYLLSIGVYPFDQSHFGETVIDINSIE